MVTKGEVVGCEKTPEPRGFGMHASLEIMYLEERKYTHSRKEVVADAQGHSIHRTISDTSENTGKASLFWSAGHFPRLSVLGFTACWGGDLDSSPFPSHDGRDPREGCHNGDPHPWKW